MKLKIKELYIAQYCQRHNRFILPDFDYCSIHDEGGPCEIDWVADEIDVWSELGDSTVWTMSEPRWVRWFFRFMQWLERLVGGRR